MFTLKLRTNARIAAWLTAPPLMRVSACMQRESRWCGSTYCGQIFSAFSMSMMVSVAGFGCVVGALHGKRDGEGSAIGKREHDFGVIARAQRRPWLEQHEVFSAGRELDALAG